MITISVSGSTSRTKRFLEKVSRGDMYQGLDGIAQRGVAALAAATPVDSGLTAASWSYELKKTPYGVTISWINTHVSGSVNVAVILQYGHGTGTGGFVAGRDYINPALAPVLDELADQVWKKVTSE